MSLNPTVLALVFVAAVSWGILVELRMLAEILRPRDVDRDVDADEDLD